MSPEVIQFGQSAQDGRDEHNQLDEAGETILGLLHKAADAVDENSRHALEMAQKLSDQLRAAEDRVAELEEEVGACRERAERAEQWLHRVYAEIENRLLQPGDARRAMNGAPQRPQKRSR